MTRPRLFRGVGPREREVWMERVTDFIEEASPKRETVIRALDECYDPCCRDRKISVVDMVLTSGWCPFAARLLEMIKEEIGKLPAVDAVDVEVVWDPTWTPERMSAGAREKLRLPLEKLAPLREARLRGESA